MSKATYLTATGNRFENINAYKGGAMYFDNVESQSYTITNNTFVNCTATFGGAIYNNIKALDLQGNFFLNNSALNYIEESDGSILYNGDGGAIYNSCP